jgi:hypothetical protein
MKGRGPSQRLQGEGRKRQGRVTENKEKILSRRVEDAHYSLQQLGVLISDWREWESLAGMSPYGRDDTFA